MKQIGLVFAMLLIGIMAFGQAPNASLIATPSFGQGEFYAPAYNYATSVNSGGSASSGTYSIVVMISTVTLPGGRSIVPYSTSAPITIGQGSSLETVTPSGVSGCNANAGATRTCTITATFSYAHAKGDIVRSGTYGLQEALNDANTNGGGFVVVDPQWAGLGGTTSTITGATGYAKVVIADRRGTNNQIAYYSGTTPALSAPSQLRAWCTGTVGSAESDYLNGAACSGATSATSPYIVAQAGTLANLRVNMGTAVKSSASGVAMTMYKNGSSTTLTCTVATATKTCSDTTHTVTVAAGDIIQFLFGATNSTDTAANVGAAVQVF